MQSNQDIPVQWNRPKVIAVDFDDTLFKEGKLNLPLVSPLIEWRKAGNEVVLFTCRSNGLVLEYPLRLCRENGLEFDAVNQNSKTGYEVNGGYTTKVWADIYIDDKGITSEAFLMVDNAING